MSDIVSGDVWTVVRDKINKAVKWASAPIGEVVESGLYSARHYANASGTSATASAASASAAAGSASTANTKAGEASTSATAAAGSASAAATSETNAANSATAAQTNAALSLKKADNLSDLTDADIALNNLGFSALGKTLRAIADAAAGRTALGLGSAAVLAAGGANGAAVLNADAQIGDAALGRGRTSLVTLSGALTQLTGIPATANRVTVTFRGLVNTSGIPMLRARTASGSITTGYATQATGIQIGAGLYGNGLVTNALWLGDTGSFAAGLLLRGQVVFTRHSANIWIITGSAMRQDGGVSSYKYDGEVDLGAAALTGIDFVTASGTFSGGNAVLAWE